MKRFFFACFLIVAGYTARSQSASPVPWTQAQLVEPSVLAAQLQLPISQRPVVIDVGPAGVISGARVAGPAGEKEGLGRLKKMLADLPREKPVIIYCGCCPFEHCPNVRPAFQTLLSMGFRNPRLLNLPRNLKADWIDRGFPLAPEE
ncbi:rhodanese-like domain-containing protein [Compostibacter hankyongensis]|uniref:Rhodanese-like domain-containing protein n=1 Tax=Compostibacter hankyongensis TaxID=1007089 RepID=A0ABP8FNQ5_9BACT